MSDNDSIIEVEYDNDNELDIGYPTPNDDNFQSKIYKKREFYYYKMADRPELDNYASIEEYRKKICEPSGELLEHQAMLGNFINPETPYKGLLIFHGTGTGKCVLGDTNIKLISVQSTAPWETGTISIHQLFKRYANLNSKQVDNENGEWYLPNEKIKVLSYKEEICSTSYELVKNIYREFVDTDIYTIELENGMKISKTEKHALYVDDKWNNIVKLGDNVLTINNGIYTNRRVISVEKKKYVGFVYDLEIENTHTYVGNGIITHNTCAAIAIGERFKNQVQRYGTQIYILVPGPLLKESWKEHFIKCTGETYIKTPDNFIFLNKEEKDKIRKQGILNAQQYYNIMSYKSFYRKVLGEKIIEKHTTSDNKVKNSYKKNVDGEFERDIGLDRLYNLNNSLIICEEAHNLTGNAYGEALKYIINKSINLRVVLLTATPMKNLGDDIVELLNFLRPKDSQIQRDKIFTPVKNHLMELKPGGLEYLGKMAHGYVSHLRGADPMTFAEKVDMGSKPKKLLFTKITRCEMLEFQKKAYEEAKKLAIEEADSLDKKSEAVANFVFPALDKNRKHLIGLYGKDGLNQLNNQLKNHKTKINELIAKDILGLKSYDGTEYLSINNSNKNISGEILKRENLKYFSIKFYTALMDIECELFVNKENKDNKESRTGFVYSNLVTIGIQIFQEILLTNGYLEFNENKNNYQIKDSTICYNCGKKHSDHKEYDKDHAFYPATFIVVTGQNSEEGNDSVPENNKQIITNVFNNFDNRNGKNIKLVLGSKVMNEGISLMNVRTVQILDVYFNFGRVDQVIGRAIRWCSHYRLMNEKNIFPKVKVFKYAVCEDVNNQNELSTEENLYYKAELKYLLIKKIERQLKIVAIDCPLNQQGNMFKEEIDEYSKCVTPTIENSNNPELIMCPAKCDFTKCDFKCKDPILNTKYYDPTRGLYKRLTKNQLDYSTFTSELARSEIEFCKKKIKELYMKDYVYNLDAIIDYVKKQYNVLKIDLFDDFFVHKALDELLPITENDFNNFRDIIYDKTYRSGYLIYLDGYYLYQPFDENENIPMHYRTVYQYQYNSKLSLHNFLINEKNITDDSEKLIISKKYYNFNDVIDYYDSRDEFSFVGILDYDQTNDKDVFKIREKRDKILDKKRGTGIPSLKGSVCYTSKHKDYLIKLLKKIGISASKLDTKDELCVDIMEQLIELEKYSVGKNKITYIMVPANHSVYKFPLNIQDREIFIKNKVEKLIGSNVDFNSKNKKIKSDGNLQRYYIELSFKLNKKNISSEIYNKIIDLGFEYKDDVFKIVID